jgi:hypothetical protein
LHTLKRVRRTIIPHSSLKLINSIISLLSHQGFPCLVLGRAGVLTLSSILGVALFLLEAEAITT